jgi:hypothetical protein
MLHRLLAALAAALMLAACGLLDEAPTTPGGGGAGVEPVLVVRDEPFDDLPPVTVADALGRQGTDQRLLVRGALFVAADGTTRLCDAIAESFPPQCGGARIEVLGLDLSSIDGLQQANGVRWAESATVFGSVE